MIPMNVCGDGRDGTIGLLLYNLRNIANAQPRIDQQTALRAVQKVAMRFFPMAVFADYIGIRIDFVYGKPILHPYAPYPFLFPVRTAKEEQIFLLFLRLYRYESKSGRRFRSRIICLRIVSAILYFRLAFPMRSPCRTRVSTPSAVFLRMSRRSSAAPCRSKSTTVEPPYSK